MVFWCENNNLVGPFNIWHIAVVQCGAESDLPGSTSVAESVSARDQSLSTESHEEVDKLVPRKALLRRVTAEIDALDGFEVDSAR